MKLSRAQVLYIDKFIVSASGVVALQYFEDARKDLGSGLTKRTVNPADKQDVDEAIAFVSEKTGERCREILHDNCSIHLYFEDYLRHHQSGVRSTASN